MKAVIRTGGKQYLVGVGDVLEVEKLPGSSGDKVVFEEVLLVSDEESGSAKLGNPLLTGAKVEAEVVSQIKADKVVIFKMKRRKRYRRKTGHRQKLTKVKITKIT
ncbi:50S ribosomal protein L21 [candidate division Kazan bacterium RBG_13_50_9]|uniref:Large ribosomal subunit protein bL21 n=1 Tax=candidate division Kazan bacterium RBG_13_50_9 TaxID=1798535 RepID=A0A1F4NRM7_UNCK3|nr:MAG: 50S ribosomal protein L21 [candidate division Kazan bacterium RBG_13_50_9]